MRPPFYYYEVLGAPKNASQEDIKTFYHKRVRECHPDLNPDDKAAEDRFKNAQEAYDVLSNEEKRLEYDLEARRLFREQLIEIQRGKNARQQQWRQAREGPSRWELGARC